MMERLFRSPGRLPVIIQAERTECALACIAMVCCYYGRAVDLNTLRRHHPVASGGSSLQGILDASAATGLSTRALRCELEGLGQLQLPAVLHWDMAHFVVLSKVSRKQIVIHDPAAGRRHYSLEEASRHFTGIAVEFSPNVEFSSQTQLQRTRLWELFERHPGFSTAVAQLFLFSLLLQLVSIGSAFYLQLVIDEGLAKQNRDFLTVLALGFLLLATGNVAMTWARAQVQLYFSNQLGFQMVSNVFHHLISLPVAFFEKRHVGDLVSRFGSVREIRRIITEDLITVVLDGIFALLTLLVMFYFSPVLASVVLVFVLLVTGLKIALLPRLRSLQEQQIVAEARTSTNLMENMRAIEVIKFYCREVPRISLWRNHYADQINSSVALARFSIRLDAVYGFLQGLENVLIIYIAALFVLDGSISLGFLTAFVALKGNFAASIRSFVDKLVQIRLVKLQLERVSDITCTEKELESLHLPRLRQPLRGHVQMDAVCYQYPGTHRPVVDSASLEIQAGEIIALLGPSGSGKSTLVRIMAGLLQPDSGAVKVDGVDLNQFGLRQYRDACAGVLQTDQLLSGTLTENITLFAEEVDFERLQQAARMARIEQFIQSLPMAYNSLVGDMGSIMSAGQGQRILLARAFYKQPRILFLDEATANLDPETEQEILRELASLKVTTILVTHRQEPLSIASRVFVFRDGKLTEAAA